MCMITKSDRLFVATEDILCYKIMCSDLRSLVQEFQYELNKLYETEFSFIKDLVINDKTLIAIKNGFHSYISKDVLIEKELPFVDDPDTFIIVECTIPKGAEYYTSVYGSYYCSNKIIINKIIATNEEILSTNNPNVGY